MKVRKAIFPVAGYGTRMLPATKAIPKEMITLIDKPLIQYAVEEAVAAGIQQIIFVTGRSKRAVEDHFDINVELTKALWEKGRTKLYEDMKLISTMADIVSVRQKEQLGLGHAILCAKEIVNNEPFAVLLPDDIFLSKEPVIKQLVTQYSKTPKSIISLMNVKEEHTHRYGIVDIEKEVSKGVFQIRDMQEKPKDSPLSNHAIMGRYVLDPRIFDLLEKVKPEAGEIQLTSALRELAKTGDVYGYEFEGLRFDCGNKVGLLEATLSFAAANEELAPELKRIIAELK